MNNKCRYILQLLTEAEQDMKNSADQGGCYPQRLKSSSYLTNAEFNNCFISHSKYFPVLKGVSPFPSLLFCLPKIMTTLSPGFLDQLFNNVQRAALLTSF